LNENARQQNAVYQPDVALIELAEGVSVTLLRSGNQGSIGVVRDGGRFHHPGKLQDSGGELECILPRGMAGHEHIPWGHHSPLK